MRESKSRADGTCPVYLRVTANRKSRYSATGVYVRPKEWNPVKQEVRASHEIAPTLNERLRRLFNEAHAVAGAVEAQAEAVMRGAVEASVEDDGLRADTGGSHFAGLVASDLAAMLEQALIAEGYSAGSAEKLADQAGAEAASLGAQRVQEGIDVALTDALDVTAGAMDNGVVEDVVREMRRRVTRGAASRCPWGRRRCSRLWWCRW